MKPSIIFVFFFSLLGLQAQSSDSTRGGATPTVAPSGADRVSLLRQEYMMQREAWLKLRRAAIAESKSARNEPERSKIKARLLKDELPVLAKMDAASRAYREALQEKKNLAKPRS